MKGVNIEGSFFPLCNFIGSQNLDENQVTIIKSTGGILDPDDQTLTLETIITKREQELSLLEDTKPKTIWSSLFNRGNISEIENLKREINYLKNLTKY